MAAGKKYGLDPANTEEYSIEDYTFTAQKATGAQFPFRKTVGGNIVGLLEDAMYDNKPESKTAQGSGPNPRAHTRVLNKPTCELTMTVDTATSFQKWLGVDGQCKLLASRRTPTGPAIADHIQGWKPLFGGVTLKSGDVATVKVTGNALRIDLDVRGIISSTP